MVKLRVMERFIDGFHHALILLIFFFTNTTSIKTLLALVKTVDYHFVFDVPKKRKTITYIFSTSIQIGGKWLVVLLLNFQCLLFNLFKQMIIKAYYLNL